MNHPKSEDWMSYLYDELPPDRRRELDRHAADCPECHAQLEVWRGTAGELDRWVLPVRHAGVARTWRYARWAAAAALMIGLGFALARLTSPPATALGTVEDRLRAEFEQLARTQAAQHAEHREAMVQLLGRLEAQRLADYARLRRDMETVAVLAEDELASTRQQLVRLASHTEPAGAAKPTREQP
jgi:hypothetical protein